MSTKMRLPEKIDRLLGKKGSRMKKEIENRREEERQVESNCSIRWLMIREMNCVWNEWIEYEDER